MLNMLQKITLRSLICLLFLLVTKNSWTWSGLTHYYISSQVSGNEEFKENNLTPDIFALRSLKSGGAYIVWEDISHSPEPKTEFEINYPIPTNLGSEGWRDKPNIANMMLKVTGYDNQMAQGYGGHIAADWIAHSTEGLTLPVLDGHAKTELIVDLYVRAVHAEAFPWHNILTLKTNVETIKRGLINYQFWLNLLEEEGPQIYTDPDFTLYDIDPDPEEVRDRIRALKNAAILQVYMDFIDNNYLINDFRQFASWVLVESFLARRVAKEPWRTIIDVAINSDPRDFPGLIENSIATVNGWASWASSDPTDGEYAFGMHINEATGAPQRIPLYASQRALTASGDEGSNYQGIVNLYPEEIMNLATTQGALTIYTEISPKGSILLAWKLPIRMPFLG